MRNLELVDAVIALHSIATTVQKETEDQELSHLIRECADRLHYYSIDEGRANKEAHDIINKVIKNDI
jgi:hypothetical protein